MYSAQEELMLEFGRRITPSIKKIVTSSTEHLMEHDITFERIVGIGQAIKEQQEKLSDICPVSDLVYLNMLANVSMAIAMESAMEAKISKEDCVATLLSVFLSHIAKLSERSRR